MKKEIEELKLYESIKFIFQNEEFTLTRFDDRNNNVDGCSVCRNESWINTMNVEKVTSKYITVFTFDMMDQKTTFKFPIDDLEFVNQNKDE